MGDLFLDPHGDLDQVHPDLVKVIETADQRPQPFGVVYGIRSKLGEIDAVRSHHSETLHSRHLSQVKEHGWSCAVDVAAIIDGKLSWALGHEEDIFSQIALQVLAAAAKLKIPVQWGGAAIGAWVPGKPSHFHDWGHFQLPWKEYP